MSTVQTTVIRTAIIAALTEGPATAREIEQRMGVVPGRATSAHLRQLEHEGHVQIHRVINATHGKGRQFVWKLAEKAERAA
ncbi:MAG TPA: winged helix-turn-helix domain-containing protein [Verrucomicrobiae bacterium]|nr:winged helix-turn-helix domain-containing protein [Verrucomicrobiae bacterium]